MRPLYLKATNWRGYASLELDFRSVQAVLVTGDTGAGKSNILGLILWCLTDKNGSTDPRGHVKTGADVVEGELQFARAGSVYRIVKSQSFKTARPKSDLQFTVSDGTGGWIPKGGKSIDDTQAEILRTIGMGYEELTCGPFALQKQAAKFLDPGSIRIDGKTYTGKSARLQVTVKMLGLEQWERWRIQASKQAGAVDGDATALEAQVAAADRELAQRPVLEAAVQQATVAQEEHQRRQADCRERIGRDTGELAAQRATVEPRRRELAGFADTKQTLWTKDRRRTEKRTRITEAETLLARREQIEAAVRRAGELDTLLATQRQELAAIGAEGKGKAAEATASLPRATEAAERWRAVNSRLLQARTTVEGRPALQAQVAQLGRARNCRTGLLAEIAVREPILAAKREQISTLMTANLEAQRKAGEIEAEAQKKAAERAGHTTHLQSCHERARLIGEVPCRDNVTLVSTCPLLENAREAETAEGSLKAAIGALDAWVRPEVPPLQDTAPLKAEIAVHEELLGKEKAELARFDREIASLTPVEAALASVDTVEATIPGLQAESAAAEAASRTAGDQHDAIERALEEIRTRYRGLEATITSTEDERSRIREAGEWSELLLAERELPGLQAEVAELDAEIQQLQATLAREPELRQTLTDTEAAIRRLETALATLQAEGEQHRAAEQVAVQRAATARAALAALEQVAGNRTTAAIRATELRADHTRLLALELAYQQIPIMILENQACPMLEEETNRFLATVSRNRMQVRIATQREVKSRDALADGLEIFVRDWRGERSLDGYSGGQEDELAIAFRVAWTRLQERRSGVGIDALFLDEVFASLSEGDLDAVLAALRAAQSEFSFLAVISHVSKLRDVFPCQVRVTGGHEDSQAELVVA